MVQVTASDRPNPHLAADEISLADLPAGAALLDVREADEWAAGHAPGALHLPMSELAGRLDEVPEASPLYVICRSGGRSERVTKYLNANGWDAVNVVEGMGTWAAAGRTLVSESDAVPRVL